MTEPLEQTDNQTPEREAKTRRTGQIIRRGENRYLVRVYLGASPLTGKRRYHNHTVRGPKKDAQKYLNAKPLGDSRLPTLRPLDIQGLYARMQERGLSPRVVRATHVVLSSALKQGVKWGILARNPAELAELPKVTRKEMRALSQAEAAQWQAALADDPQRTVLLFALASGCRPEEYLALQWKDVDLQKGTATVQRVLIRRTKGGGWYFTEPKTPRSRRTIPLPSSLARELGEHKRRQNEARLQVGSLWQNNDLVFCTQTGTPLDAHNLRCRHFKPALRRAGLPENVRLYDLRHTCATLLLSAGVNPKVVAERLGHASIVMTLDVYSHVLPDLQQRAAEKLEEMLFG